MIAIRQHDTSVEEKSSCINVPIGFGYVSHFREQIKQFFVNQAYPINYFQFDLEYILFLYSLKRD